MNWLPVIAAAFAALVGATIFVFLFTRILKLFRPNAKGTPLLLPYALSNANLFTACFSAIFMIYALPPLLKETGIYVSIAIVMAIFPLVRYGAQLVLHRFFHDTKPAGLFS